MSYFSDHLQQKHCLLVRQQMYLNCPKNRTRTQTSLQKIVVMILLYL
jgi:hypothetical protein